LDGEAAIVTGAGAGMGRATAELFAVRGADVAVVDRDGDAAAETVHRIDSTGAGGSAIAVTADVTDADAVERFVDRTVEAFGRLDVLHNNAGIPMRSTPVHEVTEETWDRVIDVNLKSAFLGAKYAVPRMAEGGVVLNTASTAGIRPRTGLSAYCASKGGMITLTKQLAHELADDGIRVNAICPVATDTDMLPQFTADDLRLEDILDTIPLGRLAEPDDIAEAAVFLASDAASMITGTALEVDGGRDI
jgi:3-oxoacyl-[acyl-carrier protein] reductase